MASRATPFLRDVPLARAQSAWRECCAAAGCPPRVEAVSLPVERAIGRVTAEPIWASALLASVRLRRDGRDRGPSPLETVGAEREHAAVCSSPDEFVVLDTGDPMPDGFDAVVMREHVHYVDGRAELRAAVAPYQHTRSIGEDISATELLLPAGHRLRPVDAAAAAAAGATEVRVHRQPVVAILPTGDEMRPIGSPSSSAASCSRPTR